MKNRITNVSGQNFKIGNFNLNLDPATLICGPNFTGKSSAIEAIDYSLAGYVPGIDKSTNAIFKRLASDSPMSAAVGFENGNQAKRVLTANKRGSVSASTEHIGFDAEWKCDPVVVDSSVFFDQSATQRVRYLFARAKVTDTITVKTVVDAINSEVKLTAANAQEVMKQIATFGASMKARMAGKLVQDWLTELLEDCRAWKKRCADAMREAEAGSQAVGASMTQFFDGEKVERELADARKAHETALKNVLTCQQALDALNLALGEAEAGREAAGLKTTAEKAIGALQAKLDALPAPDKGAQKRLQDALDKATKKWHEAQRELAGLDAAVEAAETCYKNAATARKEVTALTHCPNCGAEKKHWTEKLVEVVEEQFTSTVATMQSAKFKRDGKNKDCITLIAEQTHARNMLDGFNAGERDRAKLSQDLSAAKLTLEKSRALAEKFKSIPDLKRDINAHTMRVKDAQKEFATAQTRLAAAEEASKTLATQRAQEQAIKSGADRAAKMEIEASVARGAEKAVDGLLNDLTNKSVGKLLDTMNKLCGGILLSPLCYQDGDIGRMRGNKFVSFQSFSGTEKALTSCAVSLALASESDLKLAVLDELGRLDSSRKLEVVKRVLELVDNGTISQFVGIDVTPEPYRHIRGLAVVELK